MICPVLFVLFWKCSKSNIPFFGVLQSIKGICLLRPLLKVPPQNVNKVSLKSSSNTTICIMRLTITYFSPAVLKF